MLLECPSAVCSLRREHRGLSDSGATVLRSRDCDAFSSITVAEAVKLPDRIREPLPGRGRSIMSHLSGCREADREQLGSYGILTSI